MNAVEIEQVIIEQVETIKGKLDMMLMFKSPFQLKCKLHDLNFNSPSPL